MKMMVAAKRNREKADEIMELLKSGWRVLSMLEVMD